MIEQLKQLVSLLEEIDRVGSASEKKAAGSLCRNYAGKIEVQTSGDKQFQWQRCALASSARTPEALEVLRAHAKHSQFPEIRRMAAEELDLKTAQYAAVGGRRQMPGEAISMI